MSILSAILQGVLQGLTEFLPVSSSGHLSLYQYFTGINSESSNSSMATPPMSTASLVRPCGPLHP